MKSQRGKRNGILVVGDSLPANQKTVNKLESVLDPSHSVYNSLIIPIKYYLDNYLNSQGYQLPLELAGEDFFYYINAIDDPTTKSNPNLIKLKQEVERPEHKIILSMGNFAFYAVEAVLSREVKKNLSIVELGQHFYNRLNVIDVNLKVNFPILHNVANLKFEDAIKFITKDEENHISYFHYVGVQLGKLLMNNIDVFTLIVQERGRVIYIIQRGQYYKLNN